LHPAYQPISTTNAAFCDAAIIKVDQPFIFHEFVQKINLPPPGYDPRGTTL